MEITSNKSIISSGSAFSLAESYETGWVVNSVWTNQHLGTVLGGNVLHNLNKPLKDLIVQVYISTDGTDANSWQTEGWIYEAATYGYEIHAVDNNSLIVQTCSWLVLPSRSSREPQT